MRTNRLLSPMRTNRLLSPKRRGEESQGRKELQASEQHADREHKAPEGVHRLEALGSTDLTQAWSDHVERGRYGGGGGKWGEVRLDSHEERRQHEHRDPGGEEP